MSNPIDLFNRLSPETQIAYLREKAKQEKIKKEAFDHTLSVADWIERYFYVPELHGPLQLAKYQRTVLDEAFRTDSHGDMLYSTIVWGDIKKSLKSCIAAGVALKTGFSREWASCYTIANDLKGADSRVGYYMRRAIELHPTMRHACAVRHYRIELPNHSFIESIPIDPTGEAGSNADMVTFSELWGAHEDAQQQMWSEMTTPPNKFGRAFRWVETYAGYAGKSVLLEQLWHMCLRSDEGEWLDLGMGDDLEVYVHRPGRILCLWNTRPRLSFQTPAYYAEQEATLTPNEFLRLHRNQWVSDTEEFVPQAWWNACHWKEHGLPAMPPMKARQPCVFGIDAGISNDHFGIVGCWKQGNNAIPFYAKEWIPPKNGKIDFRLPEAEIRKLAKEYNVVEWAYDSYQLHDMTTRLRRDAVGYFREFPQSGGDKSRPGRPISDKLLYDVIQQRRIIHDGNAVLTEHIFNANAQVEGQHERMKILKRSPMLKIDCAIALSMACCESLRLNIG